MLVCCCVLVDGFVVYLHVRWLRVCLSVCWLIGRWVCWLFASCVCVICWLVGGSVVGCVCC